MAAKGDDLHFLKNIGAPELFDKLVSELLRDKPADPRVYLLERLWSMRRNTTRVHDFVEEARIGRQQTGGGMDILTDITLDDSVEAWADRLLRTFPTLAELKAAEASVVEMQEGVPLVLLQALKAAVSRRQVLDLPSAMHVTIVVPVLQEDLPCFKTPGEVAGGEDASRRKVRQMEWLGLDRAAPPAAGQPYGQFTWDIIYADADTGLRDVLAKSPQKNCRVVSVSPNGGNDAVGRGILEGLASPIQVGRGRAAQLGVWEAVNNPHAGAKQAKHVVLVSTVAGVSFDLRQCGTFAAALTSEGSSFVMGSRFVACGAACNSQAADPPGLTARTRNALVVSFLHFLRRSFLPSLGGLSMDPIYGGMLGLTAPTASKTIPLTRVRGEGWQEELAMLGLSSATAAQMNTTSTSNSSQPFAEAGASVVYPSLIVETAAFEAKWRTPLNVYADMHREIQGLEAALKSTGSHSDKRLTDLLKSLSQGGVEQVMRGCSQLLETTPGLQLQDLNPTLTELQRWVS